MKVVVEFIGYFRIKAGCELVEFELPDDVSAAELVDAIEQKFERQKLKISEEGILQEGVLMFYRKENGGLERIFNLSSGLKDTGERIVIANLMGGG